MEQKKRKDTEAEKKVGEKHKKTLSVLDKIEKGNIRKKTPSSNRKTQVNQYKNFTSAKTVHENRQLQHSSLPSNIRKTDFVSAKKLKDENESIQHMKDIYSMVHGAPIEARYGLEGHSKKRKLPTLKAFTEQMVHTVIPGDKYYEPAEKRIRFDMGTAIKESATDPHLKALNAINRREKTRASATRVKKSKKFAGPTTYRRK